MNGYARFALAAVAVVAVALGGIYVLNPAPGGSIGGPGPGATPSPSPTPAASPTPTPLPANAGTITLTDAGCTWDQPNARWIGPAVVRIDVVNETNTFGNFRLYRINDGRTWEEAAAWVAAENQALVTGVPRDVPIDFVVEQVSVDAQAGLRSRIDTGVGAGTFGVLCSANEPPPGAIFNVYLVGPLEVE